MKVYEGQGSIIQQANTTLKNKNNDGSDFQKIMDEMNSGIENKGITPGQLPPVDNGIQIIHGIEKINGDSDLSAKEKIVNDLQNTLDMVDFYSKKLADSSMSVSDLDPLVSHLEDRMGTLKDLESSSDTPEKVRPVISDMVITIGAEIAKFRRGDYI
jgi:hypothetical protein